MKTLQKIKLVIVFIALGISSMTSCTSPETISSVHQVKQLSENFQASLPEIDHADAKVCIDWGKIWKGIKTGLVDAGAFVGGFVGGAGASKHVPGLGSGFGGLMGGIAVGGAASAKYSDSEVFNGGGNGGTGSGIPVDINSLQHNTNNPYDYAGVKHYELMNQIFSAPVGPNLTDDFYNLAQTELGAYFNTPHMPIVASPAMHNEALNEQDIFDFENSYSIRLTDLQNQGKINATVALLLIPYFDAAHAINDMNSIGAFVNYSIGVENVVVNDQTISTEDKAHVLGTMATLRYGIQYWVAAVQ